ncbi:alpha/beta fold hydrolase [Lentzea sp. NPDC058436]|uniref:type I polyketide synthase n=1 Tax=Lentzea sp. NPDC058436 TaxID=3346499 RepID=UPI0036628FB6
MTLSTADYLVDVPADPADHRSLPQVFEAAVRAHGDATAVRTADGTRWTWNQWRADSRALAAGLQGLGIGTGDVVGVHLPNSWEFLVVHVAVAELGAVMLPLHMAYGDADLISLARQAGARMLFVPAANRARPSDVESVEHVVVVGGAEGEASGRISFGSLVRDHGDDLFTPAPDPGLPFVVLPSSGTTSGRPKLCLHSHGALLSNAARVADEGETRSDDVLLSASPFTHLFGLLSVHLSLLTGGSLALLPKWDVEACHDLAARSGGSVLFAVPAQLRDLTRRLAGGEARSLRLREVRTGGAAVPGSLVADVRRLTGASTIVQWGMSELGAGTATRHDDPPEIAATTIGRPFRGSEARVVDESGRARPHGEVGELQYRGPNLFRGYLGDPETTRAAITEDGWLRTGDRARLHADGTLGYAGRDAEVINVGGLKFSASEVEVLLSDLPQLAAVAVGSRQDDRLGQYPCVVVTLRPGETTDLATIRAHLLAKSTAEYKLPVELVVVDDLPLTPTGKISRGGLTSLLDRDTPKPVSRWKDGLPALGEAERRRAARTLVGERLGELFPDLAVDDDTDTFRKLGVTSLGAVRLAVDLASATGLPVATTVLFDHPTPDALARHLADLASREAKPPGDAAGETVAGGGFGDDDPIVLIGMGCRFPGGVRSPEDLWRLLSNGGETAGPFPEDRGWDLDRLRHPDHRHPGRSTTHLGHFLEGADQFDASFFGLSPREALAMDPQQRVLLETSWEALERAGLDPAALRGSDTGVFVGQMASDYGPRVNEAPELFDGLMLTGNAGSVASGRISYTLGLTGPALTVDTACSSSLVAVHLAVQALRRGECSLALACGATVMTTPASFVDFSRQGALAEDGRCKAFAANADGAAWAEGVGVLVLERRSLAVRHGHRILAVIAGSAVNQDGASNGLTAPNGLAQQRMLRAALADAGLSAGQIDVVEAHGTGTPLGDRIEAAALHAVFGTDREAGRPLRLGSVKSNLGHAQAAAGMAGIIKTAMALRHGQMPRTLHVGSPDLPDLEGDAIKLLVEPVPWSRSGRVRHAGVSAFGISGTNAHVILREPPAEENADHAVASAPALVLSARSATALRDLAAALVPVAESAGPARVASAVGSARTSFEHRAVVVPRQADGLVAGLRSVAAGTASADVVTGRARSGGRTVFVFPGQGTQWAGMAADLLDESDVFEKALTACEDALAVHVDWSVRGVLRGEGGQPSLDRVDVVQPVLFAVMVALAETWRSAGVRPDAVVGHSQGEIAAAHVAGALSLEDAVMVVARRARAVSELAGGRMAAIALPRTEVEGHLARFTGSLSVAAANGPSSTVVSGNADAVTEFAHRLSARGARTKLLDVDYASHCDEVSVIERRLARDLAGTRPMSAAVPFYSTVVPGPFDTTGLTAGYWYRNLRRPVELNATVDELLLAGHTDFVEISPHPVLLQPIAEAAEAAGRRANVMGTLRRDEGGQRRFLLSLAEAYAHGVAVDWTTVFTEKAPQDVDLPSYPFQRARYWLPTASADRPATAVRQEVEPAAAPSSEAALLDLVRNQVAAVLGGAEVGPDDEFVPLGATSLTAVELRNALATALDVSLPAGVVFDHGTPRALTAHLWHLLREGDPPQETLTGLYRHACRTGNGVAAVELISAASRLRRTFGAARARDHAPEPVRLNRPGSSPVLVCFPSLVPAGGPHEYRALATAVRDRLDVICLPQPGFAPGEPLPEDLDALVAAHTATLERLTTTAPVILCGHSSGGWVAHTVAARLAGAAGLVLLDSYWPDDHLHAALPGLLTGIAASGQVADEFGTEHHRLTAAGAYLRLLNGWRPAPVPTPTLLVRAREPLGVAMTPWQLPHTARDVPGDHFTMLTEHAGAVAEAMSAWSYDTTGADAHR